MARTWILRNFPANSAPTPFHYFIFVEVSIVALTTVSICVPLISLHGVWQEVYADFPWKYFQQASNKDSLITLLRLLCAFAVVFTRIRAHFLAIIREFIDEMCLLSRGSQPRSTHSLVPWWINGDSCWSAHVRRCKFSRGIREENYG